MQIDGQLICCYYCALLFYVKLRVYKLCTDVDGWMDGWMDRRMHGKERKHMMAVKAVKEVN